MRKLLALTAGALALAILTIAMANHPAWSQAARTIRVELVNPRTGAPLRVADRSGKIITPTVTVQASNTP